MLSIKSISASSSAALAGYYEQLAAKDDYYSKGSGDLEDAGYWLGGGSEKLGLEGEIRDGELLKMMTGHDPKTGNALAKNAGDQHKPGWDCTFSAPKTVSACWAIADETMRDKIEEAHKSSVATSLRYLEENAAKTRHGHGGKDRKPVAEAGGLVAVGYQHSTSRNQDPQLHTHVIVSNMTPEGRGIDLDTSHKMAAGALYRCELAHQLKGLGFEIERDGNSFKIAEIPEKLIEEWSSRRTEIKADMAEKGTSGAIASKESALNTRAKKESINRETLREGWSENANRHGLTADRINEMVSPEKQAERAKEAPVKPSVELKTGQEIVDQLTGQHATFTGLQSLHATAIDAQGSLSAAQVLARNEENLSKSNAVSLGIVSREESINSSLKSGDRFTTTKVLETEAALIRTAKSMSKQIGFAVPAEKIEQISAEKGFSKEQTAALNHVTNEGQIAVIEGHAGAGKSYLLSGAREAWEGQGFKVQGLALSNSAASNLKNEAGIESMSVAKFMFELENGRTTLDSKTVLVLDEAGMVGTNQTAQLVQKCEEVGAKIVLVGDSKQLQSIEAGSAMRGIGDRIGKTEMKDVRRQKDAIDREIARDFREGRAGSALEKMDAAGTLHVQKNMAEARTKAMEAYLADKADGKSSLLIAATRAEVKDLNEEVRSRLVEFGVVQKEGVIAKTEVGYREFAGGDQVVFLKRESFGFDEKGAVINGSKGTVVATFKNDGRPQIRVKLETSGAEIDVDFSKYSNVDHGYATTVHKSQGATVDTAHLVAGERTGREFSYVAVSRAREATKIYTAKDLHKPRHLDADGRIVESDLAKSMGQSQAKDFATDYLSSTKAATQHVADQRNKAIKPGKSADTSVAKELPQNDSEKTSEKQTEPEQER